MFKFIGDTFAILAASAQEMLGISAMRGCIPWARFALFCGADISAHHKEGAYVGYPKTALTNAIINRQDEMALFLLERGANPNAGRARPDLGPRRNSPALSPLLLALLDFRNGIAEELVKHGAAIDTLSEADDLRTPLGMAAALGSWNACRFLLEHGAQIGKPMQLGKTALHLAASEGGEHEVVKLLLASGAAVDAPSDDGTTPLMLAVARNHTHIADMLIDAGADFTKKNRHGYSVRDHAATESYMLIDAALHPEKHTADPANQPPAYGYLIRPHPPHPRGPVL